MALKVSPIAGLFPHLRPTASLSPSTSNRPSKLKILPLRPSFFGNSDGTRDGNVINQHISGQVIEHEESWDLSSSSPIAQAYFWTSRCLYAASESTKDLADVSKELTANFTTRKEDTEIYRDPTKFFQRDGSLERDAYQVALFLAIVYFVVQFLKNTL